MSIRRKPGAAGLALLLPALALGVSACGPASTEAPLNVVLIVVDTLRADRLTPYGYARPTSPNIARLAERALICDRAFSHSPWTMPSMATLFTSTYESVHQLSMRPAKRTDYSVLDPEYVTLAEYLHQRRYRTAAISAQVWVAEQTGFDAGFDEFSLVSRPHDPGGSQAVAMSAVNWLNASREQPFFLYLHFMAPHTPYEPPPPFDQMPWIQPMPEKFAAYEKQKDVDIWDFIRSLEEPGPNRATPEDIEYLSGLYDAEVATVDFWIGVLHREMERLDLLDNSLVVLVADHGESFFEHGQFLHISHLYNENLWIPMIVSNPVLFPEPRRLASTVGLVDVFPTLVDLLGGEPLAQFQGESVMARAPDGTHFAERLTFKDDGSITSLSKIQTPGWSLIEEGEGGRTDLHRLGPALWEEPTPVVDAPEIRQSLFDGMSRQRALNLTSPFKFARKTTDLDNRMIERLRSLGYID